MTNGPPLSDATRQRLNALFTGEDAAIAEKLLIEQCGNNLPLLEKLNAAELERFRYAALKLSEGDIDSLRHAIDLAKSDWRDLLIAAGFGEDVSAHQRWFPQDS